jgi:UPF0755 protein
MVKQRKKNKGKRIFIILLLFGALMATALLLGYKYYTYIFSPNVQLNNSSDTLIYIPSSASFKDLTEELQRLNILKNLDGFIWVSQKKGYPSLVKGGCYTVRDQMSNNELVNLLRSGRQTPVNVTFNNIRSLEELAGHIGHRIEADSLTLIQLMKNEIQAQKLGFSQATLPALFIPNTYEFYWTTDAEGFLKRMHREYTAFWTEERQQKAKAINMTPLEIATLASIVDEETIVADEKPIVAGLYINRLRKGIRLQADPTIKYVLDDFTVKRILNKDLEIDSPYNTYKYAGLPPGPIRIPSIQGIKAVLNHKKHDYLYMCAKEDFSGYHNFAKTLQQHNHNAAKYRRALQKNGIWR